MILQNHRRYNCKIQENEGFWLTGKDYGDCIKQLEEYGKNHPEKWIFYCDCGMRPAKPVPIPEQLFEIKISDKCPSGILFYILFQEGSNQK